MAKRNPCNATNLEVGTPWEGCQQHGGHARCRSLGWSSYKVGVAKTWGVQFFAAALGSRTWLPGVLLWPINEQQMTNLDKWRGLFVVRLFPYMFLECFHVFICPSVFRTLYGIFLFPHVYTLGLSQMFFYQDTFSPSLLENISHL